MYKKYLRIHICHFYLSFLSRVTVETILHIYIPKGIPHSNLLFYKKKIRPSLSRERGSILALLLLLCFFLFSYKKKEGRKEMNEDRLRHAACTTGTEESILCLLSAQDCVSPLEQLGIVLQAFSWRNRAAQPILVSTAGIEYIFQWLASVEFEGGDEAILNVILENAPDCVSWGVDVMGMIRVYLRRGRFDTNTFTLDFPSSVESRLSMLRALPRAHVEESAKDGDWLCICALSSNAESAMTRMRVESEEALVGSIHARIRDAIRDVPMSPHLSPEIIVATVCYGMQCLLYLGMDIAPLRDYLLVRFPPLLYAD